MVKKHLYLEEETLELIEVFRVENNISTLSKAVNTLVKKYNENCNSTVNNLNKYIANAVVEEIKSDLLKEVSSTIKNEVKQLKSATNDTNIDTKILVELMNGIYLNEDYGNILSTNTMPHKAYTMTKERIETEIAKKHYIKSNTVK